MRKIWTLLGDIVNDFSIRKKMILFYICCVLVPLFITDGILFAILYRSEMLKNEHRLDNMASAIESQWSFTFDETASMANTLYLNRGVNEFLDARYASNLDFYTASLEMQKRTFYEVGSDSGSSTQIIMYSDNDTIVNGDHFYSLSDAREKEWYQKLQNSGADMILHFYYIGNDDPSAKVSRKVSMIRRMDYYKDLTSEKVVRLDLDYSSLVRKLVNMQYDVPIYICNGDKILCSNVGYSSTITDFSYLTGEEDISFTRKFTKYGEEFSIHIMDTESDLLSVLRQNLPLLSLLLVFNIVFPCILAILLNRSLVSRLTVLSDTFEQVEAESLKEIKNVRGRDEIGNLMHNYNRMVRRSRELIKTVYKDRMEKQQMDIARQNAELLALHSQIDPHFLFNVLEGIRMHSILKGQTEIADMIERLAVLERENVNWKRDMVRIHEEMHFIEAYLELQKHRFGDRLKYELDIDSACLEYYLPKMTLVTFVENACVHGVESKSTTTWVYVRAYEKENMVYLEIEDTGAGISEDQVEALRERMQTSSIDSLRQNTHIGIANACLRLRMITDEQVKFELDSEEGIGTLILIKIPAEKLRNVGEKINDTIKSNAGR